MSGTLTRSVTVLVVILCSITSASSEAQTQFEMNQAEQMKFKAAEARMSAELTRLYRLAAKRPDSIAKLKAAQAAWLAFRTAHIEALWPSEEPGAYGSVHPMCVAIELTHLTLQRVAVLHAMTTSVEGDVCACHWPD